MAENLQIQHNRSYIVILFVQRNVSLHDPRCNTLFSIENSYGRRRKELLGGGERLGGTRANYSVSVLRLLVESIAALEKILFFLPFLI